jgi:hypothetical protein
MKQLVAGRKNFESIQKEISELAQDLLDSGAPWIEGEPLPKR